MAGVVAAVEDLFFRAKLEATARHLHVPLTVVRSLEDLAAVVRERRPALIIVDLQAERRTLDAVRMLKTDPDLHTTPVVGYFAHVRDDLKTAAADAGCDELLPRSAFSVRLPEILRRGATAPEDGHAVDTSSGAQP